MGAFLVVRIRGTVNVRHDIQDTLKMLRLVRRYHATLVPDTPHYRGMLQKAKDYITWGEPSPELVKELLLKRGRLVGNKPLTEEFVNDALGMTVDELADKLAKGELKLNKLPAIKPVFRLHPPRGGFKGKIKRHYTVGGELGYRGGAINDLVARML